MIFLIAALLCWGMLFMSIETEGYLSCPMIYEDGGLSHTGIYIAGRTPTESTIDQSNIDKIKENCDFCLVGTVFADWLPLLERTDILQDMIALVRENGLIPLSIHHWTSLVLPLLDKLDVAGHWTYINKAWQLLNEDDAIRAIQQSPKPITAFKALLSRKKEDIEAYLEYVFHEAHVNAVDFGVETLEEIQLISHILNNYKDCT